MKRIARHFASKRGATAIEYALMLMIGALVIITAATTMGQKTAGSFNAVAAVMN
jgi:Flp pilus assembly pilin Flp